MFVQSKTRMLLLILGFVLLCSIGNLLLPLFHSDEYVSTLAQITEVLQINLVFFIAAAFVFMLGDRKRVALNDQEVMLTGYDGNTTTIKWTDLHSVRFKPSWLTVWELKGEKTLRVRRFEFTKAEQLRMDASIRECLEKNRVPFAS
ncbi:MAG: hypothetical protein OEZ39_19045 [Gammaproteobacteria bacterium]|nr:hypothetical protein [Gammaproteobacteria bacterium]MDH5653962.1 hypothetical protein [Gammaproteobacteria bacterium]